MRRGSVSERFMKCGRSVGASTTRRRGTARTSLSHVAKRARRGPAMSAEQAALARQHVEAGHEFRKQVERYWQACERWGDTQLEASQAASQEQKKGFKTAFGIEIVTEIEALLGRSSSTSGTSRPLRAAWRCVWRPASWKTTRPRTMPARCYPVRAVGRYAGRHGKNFESVLGPLRLERAYYHCELCEAGFCPRDRALGLQGGSLSPGVLRMAGLCHGQL